MKKSDLEQMIPWERDIYLFFVEQHIKDVNEQIQQGHTEGTVSHP